MTKARNHVGIAVPRLKQLAPPLGLGRLTTVDCPVRGPALACPPRRGRLVSRQQSPASAMHKRGRVYGSRGPDGTAEYLWRR